MTPNTYCDICGKKYYRCLACEKIGSWKLVCDTPEHYQIYLVIQEYQQTHSKEISREKLRNIGFTLDDSREYVASIRDILSVIFEEEI